MNHTAGDEPREESPSVVRGALAALFVFAIFATFASALAQPIRGVNADFVIHAPDDFYNGIRVSITALVASAVGMLIYRGPFSRGAIIAIAAGLALLNFDPSALWDYAREIVSAPPNLTAHGITRLNPRAEDVSLLDALFNRMHVYIIFYIVYILWTLVVLYSAYLGQFLVGFALPTGRARRRESAIYVAERAGVGLMSGLLAGLLAVVFLAGLSAAMPAPDYGDLGTRPLGPPLQPESVAPDVPGAAVAAAGPSQPRNGAPSHALDATARRTEPPARSPSAAASRLLVAPAGRPSEVAARYSELHALRAPIFITALSFFMSAYIIGFMLRPRTSTWVACGAILALVLLPLAALKIYLPSYPLEEVAALNPAVALNEASLVGERIIRYGKFFSLMEVSPFAAAATAVISALLGDFSAKFLIRHAAARGSANTFRPL